MLNNFTRQFRKILGDAGIKPCRFHDLRKTFNTHFQSAGSTLRDAQAVLGHASPMTTLRDYTGTLPGAALEALTRLPYAGIRVA